MSLRGLGAGGAALQVLMAGTWQQPRLVCSTGLAQLGEEGHWERLGTAFILPLPSNIFIAFALDEEDGHG